MIRFKRRIYWLALVAIHWIFTFWLLFRVSPIYDDGYGLSASFFWGKHPPTTYPQFLFPYWVAASIFTFMGCGLTTWLVSLWKPKYSRLFLLSSATTLFLLLLAGALSDAGTAIHIWNGPVMYGGISNVWPCLKVMIPLSLFSGVLALARDRLNGASRPPS